MKRRRTIGIIAILISVVFLGAFAVFCYQAFPSSENLLAVLETGDESIGLEQTQDGQYLFRINGKNQVTACKKLQDETLLKNFDAVFMAYETDLYVLLKDREQAASYSLAVFDSDLKLVRKYACAEFPSNEIGGLSVEDGEIYVTTLTNGRKTATAYRLDFSPESGEGAVYRAVTRIEAEEGRRLVAANYMYGTISYCYDNESPEKLSEIQNYQEEITFSRWKVALSIAKEKIVLAFIAAFLIGGLIVVFYCIIFRMRSYGIWKFAVQEAVLLLVAAGSIFAGYQSVLLSGRADRLESAGYLLEPLMSDLAVYTAYDVNMEDFEDSEGYQTTYDTMQAFLESKNMSGFFETLCMISGEPGSYWIDLALDFPRGTNVDSYFSPEITDILNEARENSGDANGLIRMNDKTCGVVVKVWDEELIPSRFLVAVIPLDLLHTDMAAYFTKALAVGGVAVLAGTLFLIALCYLESRNLRTLSKVMERICQGRQQTIEKPVVYDWDLDSIWNSLCEIYKDRDKLFYSRNRIFEAYYRFAPRNIEKLLGKETISEVGIGDMAQVNGTVGIIQTSNTAAEDQESYLQAMNLNFEIICKNQIACDGVLIPDDCNLSSMEVFFAQQVKQAVNFGIDTLLMLEECGVFEKQQAGILMHNTELLYGVAGSREQFFPFISSPEVDLLRPYGVRFRELGIRMVITETVHRKLPDTVERRYIGYVKLKETDKKLNCYEVLDAYPVSEKKQRKMSNDAFQRALELFYRKDFYLARNKFTEVLKICPLDKLATWYLFYCESMLSEQNPQNVKYGLFEQG